MADNLVWKIDAGSKVKLQDYDPGYTDAHPDHASAEQELAKLSDELGELQEALAMVSQSGNRAYAGLHHEKIQGRVEAATGTARRARARKTQAAKSRAAPVMLLVFIVCAWPCLVCVLAGDNKRAS